MSDTPDSLQELLKSMTPEIHGLLKTAVELGHWENGEKLTEEQKANCLQAVIAYDQAYLEPQQRVGYLDREGQTCGKNRHDDSGLKSDG